MVQYYTLEEAAQLLRMTPEKLKDMVRTNKVRAFQDRGTMRFRAQEIEELARSLGVGSDPERPVEEAPPPSSTKPPSSSKRRKSKMQPIMEDEEGSISDFTLTTDDESVSLGSNPPSGVVHSTPRSALGKRRTIAPRPSQLGKLPPAKAPDSDVRLVGEDGGGMDFNLTVEDAPPKSAPRKSRLAGKPDSDVKLEKADDEILINQNSAKRPSDSDIRLEADERLPLVNRDPLVTEEIDLDLEAMKAEQDLNKPRPRPDTSDQHPALPTSSPFELSDSDIEVEVRPKKSGSKSGKKSKVSALAPPEKKSKLSSLAPPEKKSKLSSLGPPEKKYKLSSLGPPEKKSKLAPPPPPEKKSKLAPPPPPPEHDSSDEFELTAFDDKSSPLEAGSDPQQVPLIEDDEEVSLGELTGGGGVSGINLSPADSGISLEQGGSDEIEFELSLDAGASPTASKRKMADPENSEFELSLQEDEDVEGGAESSSEFELTLDEEPSSSSVVEEESEPDLELESSESDSEFELTLDEGGGLTPLEETAALAEEGEEVVEETDFDVPALEEDSEEMALEESSSDFDLSVDDSMLVEDESGSQAVVLDDEEVESSEIESDLDSDFDADMEAGVESDDDLAPPSKPRRRGAAGAADGLELDLDLDTDAETDVEAEVEEDGELAAVGAAAPPAEWGLVPTLLMAPCVVVLFLVGLMGYEMIQGMWGYHKGAKVSRLIIDPMARMFDENLPKD